MRSIHLRPDRGLDYSSDSSFLAVVSTRVNARASLAQFRIVMGEDC